MKSYLKLIYAYYLFHWGGLKKEIERLRDQPLVLGIYGHDIDSTQFERYIKWLLRNEFEFISMEHVKQFIEQRLQLSNTKIWLSLDDGWRNNLQLIPIIEKYNIPLTIFIPTHPIETGYFRDTLEHHFKNDLPLKYRDDPALLMSVHEEERWEIDQPLYNKASASLSREAITIDELKELSQHPLISIGAHTHTHPMLTRCKSEVIVEEIKINLDKIENYTGIRPDFLALPNGNYNRDVIETLLQTELKYIASIKNGHIEQGMSAPVPRNGLANASFYENCCRMLDFWYPNVKKLRSIVKS